MHTTMCAFAVLVMCVRHTWTTTLTGNGIDVVDGVNDADNDDGVF